MLVFSISKTLKSSSKYKKGSLGSVLLKFLKPNLSIKSVMFLQKPNLNSSTSFEGYFTKLNLKIGYVVSSHLS